MSDPRLSIDSSEATLHDFSTTLTRPNDIATQNIMGDRPSILPGEGEGITMKEKSSSSDRPRSALGKLEHACLNANPALFSMNMGTGIASILLYNLPYNARWLQYIGIAIFLVNIILFVLISTATIIRHLRWKGIFGALGSHVLAGMYWGCMPMGLVTIVVS